MRIRSAPLLVAAWLAALAGPVSAQDDAAAPPQTLRLAVHLHSTVSTGALEPRGVVALARAARLDGAMFTDSATRRWEYGLWPLQGLIRRVVEQPSVFTFGVRRYLDTLHQLQTEAPDVITMAGLEVTPFYYWKRSPFDRRGGQIRNWHQHLLVFGLEEPETIQRLPLDAFDPYHGDQGAKPYQRLIEYVAAHGGLVFWAHPETEHIQSYGAVEAYTDPYPHLLEMTSGYQGFALTYLDHLSIVEPGGVWDRLLEAYYRGQRPEPVWVLGELDWRGPQERPLDKVVTMVSVPERSPRGVLQALRQGRMWVVFRVGAEAPTLDRFEVTDLATQRTVTMGDALRPTGAVRIRVSGHAAPGPEGPTQALVIKNGETLGVQEIAASPFDLEWTDERPQAPGCYRVIVKGPSGLIYTNPIFLE